MARKQCCRALVRTIRRMFARQYARHAAHLNSVSLNLNYNEDVYQSALLIIRNLRRRNKKNRIKTRTCWVKPLYQRRTQNLESINYEIHFKTPQFLRVSLEEFEHLHSLVEPFIKKKDTHWRDAISTKERLAITLRYLATGDSYSSLQYVFCVSKQTISTVVPEVCDAMVEALKEIVKLPNTEEKWRAVSEEFEQKWNFPHAIGALDGKHVIIQAPYRSGTEYYNYKKYFSIILLALVDANYNFMYVNVGCQGRISDGGVFKSSQLYRSLENDQLCVPAPEILNVPYVTKIPFVILGDQAFALNKYTMTPFSGILAKGSKERIFNYRLSRARRVVENAFGIMSSKFRVLRKAILLKPSSAKKVVLATVYLHNFLRRDKCAEIPVNQEVPATQSQFLGTSPTDTRNFLARYFVTNGSIPWQYNY